MAASALTTAAYGSARAGGGRSGIRRIGVFAVGFVLNLLGAAAWLLSVLLMAPLMLAGLWVWSREFEWAERLLGRFRHWAGALWRRVRAHPVRWGLTTVLSLVATGVAYWWLMG